MPAIEAYQSVVEAYKPPPIYIDKKSSQDQPRRKNRQMDKYYERLAHFQNKYDDGREVFYADDATCFQKKP